MGRTTDDGSSSSSSSGSGGNSLPRGVIKSRRGGWEGEELEIEHSRKQQQQHSSDEDDGGDGGSSKKKTQHVAVDLNQFRNTEVGKGYQAKHVIRQRSAHSAADPYAARSELKIMDMSQPQPTKKGKKTKKKKSRKKEDEKRKRKRDGSNDDDGAVEDGRDARLLKYLRCEGIRIFRKELEKME